MFRNLYYILLQLLINAFNNNVTTNAITIIIIIHIKAKILHYHYCNNFHMSYIILATYMYYNIIKAS